MIDVYSWATSNGHKVHIMLEELGMPYRAFPVNIRVGDQFKPEFLKISPNNRIPAIIDSDGPGGRPLSLFESGAILIYLAEKSGKMLAQDPQQRYTTLQWLMWQVGGIGPMFGQANHFRAYIKEKIAYAIERYSNEARRLTNVLNKRLGEARFVAGDEYSIADIAIFPWMRGSEKRGIDLADFPNAERWFNEVQGRPAVQRGLKVLTEFHPGGPHDEKARDIMYGKTQFQQR